MTRKAQFNEPTGKRSVARRMAEYAYTAILNELDNALPVGDEEVAEILREAGIDPEYELKRAMVLVEEEEKRQQKALFERAGIIAEEDADKASEQDIMDPILELAIDIWFAKANGCDQGDCSCGESDDCLAKGWEKFVPALRKRYWIFDEDGSAQRFPLAKFIARIGELVDQESAQIVLTRSQGYGEHVCSWDDQLDRVEALPIPFSALAQVVHQTDELFYNLDAICMTPEGSVRFGLHDSSALFVDAPDALAERLTAGCAAVRKEPVP